jgi:Ca2+-binding EF-hand superfamily protein
MFRIATGIQSKFRRLIVKVKTILLAYAMAGAMTLGAAAFEAQAWAAPPSALKALDPDTDGTVDLTEAKEAASKLFDQLDPDKDGTLDRRELRGRLNAKDMAAGDPDKDGTLDDKEQNQVPGGRCGAG